MPKTKSDTSLKKALVFVSLIFPFFALFLILKSNVGERTWDGSFPMMNIRFLLNLFRYRLQFPEGFTTWTFWTFLGLLPSWLLGYGILSSCKSSKLIRFWSAFPVGIGLVGVALELLAIAHWLNRSSVLLVSIAAVVTGLLLIRRSLRLLLNLPENPIKAPEGKTFSRTVEYLIWFLFAVLTWFNFQHALFYPPDYWDALIYYLYYPKLVFLEGGIPFPVDASGFPELVQGQVGLGLGANYAHLFLLWQASVCTLTGEWNTFPGQWIAPLAGLGTAFLVFGTILTRTGNRRIALLSILVVQSAPYWIWYQHWCSDYPLAVWFTIAAVSLIATDPKWLIYAFPGLTAIAIAGSHLNYLMASLWLFPLLAWFALKKEDRLLKPILLIAAGGMVLSSIWFIRNWIVTGNPVYAFFPEIFGGINIDLEVLRSCQIEWSYNGDGLRSVGSTVWKRIAGTPYYFLGDPSTSTKWAALPLGWFVPGLLFLMAGRRLDLFRASVIAYALFLLFYEYVVSPLYLYHIMPLVPLMVVIAMDWMESVDRYRISRWLQGILSISVFIAFGLPTAFMGAKLPSPSLEQTFQPGMNPNHFLELALGDSYPTFEAVNETLPKDAILLTHENRHLYVRDDIKFLHLDDYRLIDWYGKSGEEVLARLHELGVDYYLKIPNEHRHPITKRLGVESLLADHFEEVFKVGGHDLYRLKTP